MVERLPNGGGEPFHKHKGVENYIHQGIDYNIKGQIFSRDAKSPTSIISYWKNILSREGIPTQKEEQIDYFLLQMDRVNLDGYKPDKIGRDKEYVENSISIDFENMENKPAKFNEKLLERVYGHCLAKIFEKKAVISGGNNEEISLEKTILSHPYDINKRHVQQILSIVDERYPGQLFNLSLGIQWGHENTDEEAIDNRISYIVNGITDYGSTTEICYTNVDESQAMPIYTPMVIVGGDVKKITSFVDQVMKGESEYSEASRSSLVYNAITQMKTQIDLFYGIALKQQQAFSNLQTPTDEIKKMRFLIAKDKLHETINIYTYMKNIIDQVFEANTPSIEVANTKPDIVHEKIMSVCAEIAKRNNVAI